VSYFAECGKIQLARGGVAMKATVPSEKSGLIYLEKNRIFSVIDKPDQTHEILAAGLKLSLFSKRGEARTDLVCTAKYEGHFIVPFAFRIYDDLAGDLAQMPPLDAMRAFIGKFGLDVAVGKQIRQLYLSERVPLEGMKIEAINPANKSIAMSQFFKIGDDGMVDIAMLFCLNTQSYQKRLADEN
jgi:hypothetical protein